jgi:toxin CcdB
MARFDLYRNGSDGYFLDVQTDLISGLGTRLVVPLLAADRVPQPIRRLHPIFEIEGHRFVMATHFMSAVAASQLKQPVGNLIAHYDAIVAARDMIFLGF